ncbi:PAS domain-containing protein [Enterovirga rhinocerotis]|uniref:PAS domain-containing protein n=1 Tax=Enterovirga rhinocerotis TaxID=1339210 RepID=A0A4R7C5Q5_9HYPH|nr:PAS domain-containing protein [Enterovirga rhinocerotis]TDR93728.1 hypothetical protein EV668_0993 [Enterovirga rhinocerotis]
MKHATSRMLFAYWDALRGERAAPDRAEIQPGAIRHILADTFIVAREDDRIATFRLAGTRICALLGRDLRNAPLRSLWAGDEEEDAERLADIVLEDTAGVVAGLRAWNHNGSELPMEMLLLPLRHRGRTHDRLIGTLSPATVPGWAGLVPLREISVRSLRVIEPGSLSPPADDEPFILPTSEERRRMFVVHEGGLA